MVADVAAVGLSMRTVIEFATSTTAGRSALFGLAVVRSASAPDHF